MKTTLGQPVIVENVGGAAAPSTARVARAAPDGYTIGFGQWTSHVGCRRALSADLRSAQGPRAGRAADHGRLWLVGRGDLPANNLKELIAWLKANPDKATGGTIGARQRHAALPDLFQQNTGTSSSSFRIAAPAPICTDLLAGQST